VRETDPAGAQHSAVDPRVVTIGDGTTVNVTATNTFTVGQIVVTKKVDGSGASEHRDDTFTVHTVCTWNDQQIGIPGGADRSLSVADPVTYSNLPVGADCEVSETNDGGALMVAMTPASPDDRHTASVTVGDGTAVQVVVTNTFDPAPPALPDTGSNTVPAVLAAIGLLLAGLGMALVGILRRRRRA
jgi:hypothetical protein